VLSQTTNPKHMEENAHAAARQSMRQLIEAMT